MHLTNDVSIDVFIVPIQMHTTSLHWLCYTGLTNTNTTSRFDYIHSHRFFVRTAYVCVSMLCLTQRATMVKCDCLLSIFSSSSDFPNSCTIYYSKGLHDMMNGFFRYKHQFHFAVAEVMQPQ